MKRILLALGVAAIVLISGCATTREPERAPISLEEIVQMAKGGKDGPTIIGELKAAHMAYDVTASQYAKLSRDGVPDAVLDYMQQTQIRMAIREARREARYSYDPFLYDCCGPWYPRPYVVFVRGRAYPRSW